MLMKLRLTYPSLLRAGSSLHHVRHGHLTRCTHMPTTITKSLLQQSRCGYVPGHVIPTSKSPTILSAVYRYDVLRRAPSLRVYQQHRLLHTSSTRQAIPLHIWLLAKPVAKITSIIMGRYFRKRMVSQNLSASERLWRARWVIALGLAMLFSVGAVDYFTHLEETPITKRRRYLAFTPKQFESIQQLDLKLFLEDKKDAILPGNADIHPLYNRVVNVTNRIVNANQDIAFFREQKWTIVVLNDDNFNAFVHASGYIFVNTGLFAVVQNSDQLAVIIGHEMAHALLMHPIEKVGYAQLMDWLVIVLMAALWFFMPTDGIAIVSQFFNNKVLKVLIELPYSRQLEMEADEVGLHLIAKACFDVRESSNLWNKLWIIGNSSHSSHSTEVPEFLSTHPANERRAEILDRIIPKAIKERQACNCPSLSRTDPRHEVNYHKKILNELLNEHEDEDDEDDEEDERGGIRHPLHQ